MNDDRRGVDRLLHTTMRRRDGSPPRVLVVDTEIALADVVARSLSDDGWDSRTAHTARDTERVAAEFEPDVVILDAVLPDADGITVLLALRELNPFVRVIFVTTRDSVQDRIAGLTAGADDYMTKPFSVFELVARVRGLVRYAGVTAGAEANLVVADLTMAVDAHEVRRAGKLISLTPTEFDLLRYLMLNPHRVLSKKQILDQVWDYDFGGDSHVVELYISYLRKKIDHDGDPLIHTVRGLGYAFGSSPPTRL